MPKPTDDLSPLERIEFDSIQFPGRLPVEGPAPTRWDLTHRIFDGLTSPEAREARRLDAVHGVRRNGRLLTDDGELAVYGLALLGLCVAAFLISLAGGGF